MPTRRSLLQTAAVVSVFGGFARLALAAAPTDRRFVLIVLRGGMDGLSAVPPFADPAYQRQRGGLALAEPGRDDGALDLDGFFGLHPALAGVHPWYREGALLAVHAAATPYRDRSHFDAQDLLENGTAVPHGAGDGWLNRALGLLGPAEPRLGLSVGQTTPLVLRGGVPVASWAPSVLPGAAPHLLDLLADLYDGDPLFAQALAEGMRLDAVAGPAMDGTPGRRAARRATPVAMAQGAGRLLAQAHGPRIAVLELPGWDTHTGQGAPAGRLARALTSLDDALTGLRQGLGPAWGNTAVAAVSEFGRTVAPNGTGGTDHGTAGAMLLAGGAVAGGRVLADWPGLSADVLHEGRDLAPTTDVRAVLKGVLHDHLALAEADLAATVFPGSQAVSPMLGLVRA